MIIAFICFISNIVIIIITIPILDFTLHNNKHQQRNEYRLYSKYIVSIAKRSTHRRVADANAGSSFQFLLFVFVVVVVLQ